jgi:hypothetical protein
MSDEVLARLALLVGMALAGEPERLGDAGLVDRLNRVVGMLGDQREEVDQQLALLVAEAAGQLLVARRLRPRRLDQADTDVRVRQPRASVRPVGAAVGC